MWLVWVVLGAWAVLMIQWWIRQRRRGRIVRNLIAQFGTEKNELAAFIKLRFAWERTIGAKLSQQQYDALAIAVWGQPARWATAVVKGQHSLDEATKDVLDFLRRSEDPNDPLTAEVLHALETIPKG